MLFGEDLPGLGVLEMVRVSSGKERLWMAKSRLPAWLPANDAELALLSAEGEASPPSGVTGDEGSLSGPEVADEEDERFRELTERLKL